MKSENRLACLKHCVVGPDNKISDFYTYYDPYCKDCREGYKFRIFYFLFKDKWYNYRFKFDFNIFRLFNYFNLIRKEYGTLKAIKRMLYNNNSVWDEVYSITILFCFKLYYQYYTLNGLVEDGFVDLKKFKEIKSKDQEHTHQVKLIKRYFRRFGEKLKNKGK